jgi:hypothetical protein
MVPNSVESDEDTDVDLTVSVLIGTGRAIRYNNIEVYRLCYTHLRLRASLCLEYLNRVLRFLKRKSITCI